MHEFVENIHILGLTRVQSARRQTPPTLSVLNTPALHRRRNFVVDFTRVLIVINNRTSFGIMYGGIFRVAGGETGTCIERKVLRLVKKF